MKSSMDHRFRFPRVRSRYGMGDSRRVYLNLYKNDEAYWADVSSGSDEEDGARRRLKKDAFWKSKHVGGISASTVEGKEIGSTQIPPKAPEEALEQKTLPKIQPPRPSKTATYVNSDKEIPWTLLENKIKPKLLSTKLDHKVVKISATELMDAIRAYEITNLPCTPNEEMPTPPEPTKCKIGVTTIAEPVIKMRSKLGPCKLNPALIQRKMIEVNAQKAALKIDKMKQQQEAVLSKLPLAYIPTRQEPLRITRKVVTPHYAKKQARPTLSALRSSRPIKPILKKKELPGHLRYGNFAYWLWPTVVERLPSQAGKAVGDSRRKSLPVLNQAKIKQIVRQQILKEAYNNVDTKKK